MKATYLRVLAALIALAAGASIYAQTKSMKVTVPFDFVVSGQKLPAGDYTVEQATENGMITLYSADNKHTAITMSEPASEIRSADHPPSLRFRRQDGQVYLIRVAAFDGLARSLSTR